MDAKRIYLKKLLMLASAGVGKMNKRRFADFMKDSCVVNNLPKHPSNRLVDQIFSGLDPDHDGLIDNDEFYTAFENVIDDQGMSVTASSDDFFGVVYAAMVTEIDWMYESAETEQERWERAIEHERAAGDAKSNQLRQAEDLDAELRAEIEELKAQLAAMRRAQAAMRQPTEYDDGDTSVDCVGCEKLQAEVDELQDTVDDLRAYTTEQDNQLADKSAECHRLRERLADMADQSQQLETALSTEQARAGSLKTELEALRKELAARSADMDDADHRIASERQLWNAKAESLQETIDRLESNVTDLTGRLEASEMHTLHDADVQHQMEELLRKDREQARESAATIAALKAELETVQANAALSSVELIAKSAKESQLVETINAQRAEIDALQGELASVLDKIDGFESDKSASDQELRRLRQLLGAEKADEARLLDAQNSTIAAQAELLSVR